MTKVIIYPQENGSIAVIQPAQDAINLIGLEEIARKDVPAGVKYKIIDESDLPEDDEFFDAWEADFSDSESLGIGSEAWLAEREELGKPVGGNEDIVSSVLAELGDSFIMSEFGADYDND